MRFASRLVGGVTLFAMILLCGETGRAPGQPPAPKEQPKNGELPPLEEAAVLEAIDRGAEYLKAVQKADGTWTDGAGHEVGVTALAGIALIESGTRTNDASIQRAANFVRSKAASLNDTYQVSLTIMFLDRMKDPKRDDPTIQALAVRLMAGQTGTGGWTYSLSGGPRGARVPDNDIGDVIGALRKMSPPPPVANVSYRERPSRMGLCIKQSEEVVVRPVQASLAAEEYEKKRVSAVKALPQYLKSRAIFHEPSKMQDIPAEDRKEFIEREKGDNSNTHFAMVGLWLARKHGVPVERSFALVSKRFRTSQDASAGGWGYAYPQSGSAPAMTCIGLLGLACGNALNVDEDAGRLEKDQAILKSLTFLGKNVGMPVGHFKDRPKVKDVGGLYYMWALERIAVLYDISTLDKKDWYRWGAEILIGNQLQDGSWTEGGYHGEKPNLNTALAMLFLKRANLLPDLNKRLIIDSTALTARVNEPAPPPPLPPPMPKVETPAPKFELPKFEFPKEESPAPAPKTVPPPAPTETTTTTKKKDDGTPVWIWIVAGVGGLAVIGLGLFFLLRKKTDQDEDEDEDDEDEKPKKKAKKSGTTKAAKAKKSKT